MNQELHMIFGAPGCGKTTYLINLLEDLVQEYESDRIAFVSFTKKGSYEGRDRLINKTGLSTRDLPYFKTIHAICFKELGVSKTDMIERQNYREFSRAMGMNFLGFYTEDLVNNDDRYLFQVSLERNNPEMAKRLLELIEYQKYLNVRKNYLRYKEARGIMDFDDLIIRFIEQGKPLDVDVAIIDEAQDLTTLQWEFCELAFQNCEKVYIAGDDDQAIYEWSGSDVEKFLSFKERATSVEILSHSYRLKPAVLDAAKLVSGQISKRVDKEFTPSEGDGEVHHYNILEELLINSEETYYLLARNNYFLRDYKELLMKMGVPFMLKGKPAIDPALYSAIIRYEKLRSAGEEGRIRMDPYLSARLRDDVKGFPPWYDKLDIPLEEASYLRNVFKHKTDPNNLKIHVSTIHGVKGGEADNVVIRLDVTKGVSAQLNLGMLDSELRVLYVGMTRAKKNLHFVYSTTKFGYDRNILTGAHH